MLAPLFYAWERRLHAHSKDDRTVRPFDWGLDWLGSNGHGPTGQTPDEMIACWARAALADSDSFFAAPPTHDYTWDADPAVAQKSSAKPRLRRRRDRRPVAPGSTR